VVDRVITGGQSGADLGAWNSARNAGRRAAGEMPSGFLTEDGPRPEYAVIYGATAGATDAYPERTRANVAASDAALIAGHRPAALFVGGNRESKAPGMARFVEYFLDDVFRLLAKDGPR
jgi:hypothetical protein